MNRNKVTIVLNDNPTDFSEKWTDVLRVGDWTESYKEFSVTLDDLSQVVANFQKNVLRLDKKEIQFNYSHASYAEAAGWIEDLRISNNVLQAKVRWTPKAKERIEGEEFKYVSAELDFNYRDEETRQAYGMTLTGAALTNIPFVRGLQAVALSDNSDAKSVFLFSKPFYKMDKFKQLLSTLEANTAVSLNEVVVLKGAMAMLSEEEQAEVSASVTAIEETAQANADAEKTAQETAQAEAETKEAELSDLRNRVKLSDKDVNEQVKTLSTDLTEAQKQLSEAQKELDKLKLDARKTETEAAIKELSSQGKILPKDVDATVVLLLDESPAKAEKWLNHFKSMPAVVALDSEQGFDSDGHPAPQDADLPAKALALAEKIEKEQGVSLNEAISMAYNQLIPNN